MSLQFLLAVGKWQNPSENGKSVGKWQNPSENGKFIDDIGLCPSGQQITKMYF
jgi:hypothetical protein